jgi:hypothetical protein
VLCSACGGPSRVYRCGRCGTGVRCIGEPIEPDPAESAGLCSRCYTLGWLAGVPDEDKAAIRAAASRGMLAAVQEARARLGRSLLESVSAVHALCDPAELECAEA